MKNVFEFLGLPKDHRVGDKVTMRVKHYDEVPESKKTWPMLGQIKRDGCYALVVKRDDKKVGIFSRTGKRFTNVKQLESKFSASDAPAGVYIAELCNDSCALEVLSGLINPNRLSSLSGRQIDIRDKMYLSFHDYIAIESLMRGSTTAGYKMRYGVLKSSLPKEFDLLKLYPLRDEKEMEELFQLMHLDEEGIVIKQSEQGWVAGHKGYRMMKKVRGVSYDLRCIRAEEGKGKMKGKVGNLFFAWKNGREIKCPLGKGWTHEDAQEMWCDYVVQLPPTKHPEFGPVGKIFEVYALQESSKGVLRLPKAGERRHDKEVADE